MAIIPYITFYHVNSKAPPNLTHFKSVKKLIKVSSDIENAQQKSEQYSHSRMRMARLFPIVLENLANVIRK